MESNHYLINMQKLLFIAEELHNKGFEKLRVIPSEAPNGLAWRCGFITDTALKGESVIVTNWICKNFNIDKRIKLSIQQLTEIFEKDHPDFLNICRGKNKEYCNWYSNMLKSLKKGELPFFLIEDYCLKDCWETTEGQKIKTLANEKEYFYYN